MAVAKTGQQTFEEYFVQYDVKSTTQYMESNSDPKAVKIPVKEGFALLIRELCVASIYSSLSILSL